MMILILEMAGLCCCVGLNQTEVFNNKMMHGISWNFALAWSVEEP